MSDDSWQIRPGELSDLRAVERIERASFGDPWSATALLQELASSPMRLSLVAVNDQGELAGYLMAWRSVDQLHILNLAVDPSLRRRKIATRLMRAALDNAYRSRLEEVTLEVRPGNEAALELYRAFGFQPAGLRPGYYTDTGEEALILTLPISGFRPLNRESKRCPG